MSTDDGCYVCRSREGVLTAYTITAGMFLHDEDLGDETTHYLTLCVDCAHELMAPLLERAVRMTPEDVERCVQDLSSDAYAAGGLDSAMPPVDYDYDGPWDEPPITRIVYRTEADIPRDSPEEGNNATGSVD